MHVHSLGGVFRQIGRPLPAAANIPAFLQAIGAIVTMATGGVFLGLHFQPVVGIAAILAILLLLTFLAAWRLQSELADRDAQLPPAIRALREELKYIKRRVHEWTPNSSTPELPATEWNRHKDLLRECLEEKVYILLWEFFDLVDRSNRNRGSVVMGPGGFAKLTDVLYAADEALEDQLSPSDAPQIARTPEPRSRGRAWRRDA